MAFEESGGGVSEGSGRTGRTTSSTCPETRTPRAGRPASVELPQAASPRQTGRRQDSPMPGRPPADRRPVASFDPKFSATLAPEPAVPAGITHKRRARVINERKVQLNTNAIKVLERRYLKKGEDGTPIETPEDMLRRVAENIALAEMNYGSGEKEAGEVARTFYDMMTGLDFLPNSPTLMNAGRGSAALRLFRAAGRGLHGGIFDAIKRAALIHQSGGGTGFSFSRLRPRTTWSDPPAGGPPGRSVSCGSSTPPPRP